MADEIDQANDLAEMYLADALSRRVEYKGQSLSECDECGAEIPAARQKAVQGCKHCVDCAAYFESKRNTYRKIEDEE